MIRLVSPRSPSRDAELEDLLHNASEFRPDEGAPMGLEWRALNGLHARRAAGLRLQRMGLAAALVAGAVAVLFIMPRGRPGQDMATIDGRILPPDTIGSLRETRPAPLATLASHVPDAPRRGVSTPVVSIPPPLAPRGERSARKAGKAPVRRSAPARNEAPTVRWEVETVRYDVARVLTPGYIVEGEDENGELKLTPTVVELVTRTGPDVSACGAPGEAPDPTEAETPAGDSGGTNSSPAFPGAPVEEKDR